MQTGAGLYFDWHIMGAIACTDRLGSYHYVKEGRMADDLKTSVVVQARYTESQVQACGAKTSKNIK